MSDDHQIVKAGENELHPLIQASIDVGATVDDLHRMMDLQVRHENRMAKKEFDAAIQRLIEDLPVFVGHNKKGHNSDYADLPQVMSAITPALRKHGFGLRWKTNNDGKNEVVTCLLSYGGYTDETTRAAPPDKKGGKSDVQASQSTVTYLQRRTVLQALGIVTADMPDADDTQSEVNPDKIDIAKNLEASTFIRRKGRSVDEACEMVGRPVREWTAADLDKLREWVKVKPKKPPLEPKKDLGIHADEPPDDWKGNGELFTDDNRGPEGD
jgi:hypothetical protein